MKDKFQYTARGVIHYSCPCCAAKWMTNKLEYCPNCEVKLQYAEPYELPTIEDIRFVIHKDQEGCNLDYYVQLRIAKAITNLLENG